MILIVAGTPELMICSTCKERWIGVQGEPRTQEWQQVHDKKHPLVGGKLVPFAEALGHNDAIPHGFDRHGQPVETH